MALTEADVRGIADYARIALEGPELEEMTAYLNDAVDMLAPVLAYDLPDIESTFHPIGDPANVMREDEELGRRDLPLETALENAASTRERYFRVPSILGEGDR